MKLAAFRRPWAAKFDYHSGIANSFKDFKFGNKWCWLSIFNCVACRLQPDLLLRSPRLADCYCCWHMKTWAHIPGPFVPEDCGMFSLLSRKALFSIALNLSAKDLGALMLAFPLLTSFFEDCRFIRKNLDRFKDIGAKDFTTTAGCMRDWGYVSGRSDLCERGIRTQSNHCVACMLDPTLLTMKPAIVNCYCVDHLTLHAGPNVILWEKGPLATPSELSVYPACGFKYAPSFVIF